MKRERKTCCEVLLKVRDSMPASERQYDIIIVIFSPRILKTAPDTAFAKISVT